MDIHRVPDIDRATIRHRGDMETVGFYTNIHPNTPALDLVDDIRIDGLVSFKIDIASKITNR
ncbi:hypothetical protein JOD24_002533 [Kroppenstedtia sanguinis]